MHTTYVSLCLRLLFKTTTCICFLNNSSLTSSCCVCVVLSCVARFAAVSLCCASWDLNFVYLLCFEDSLSVFCCRFLFLPGGPFVPFLVRSFFILCAVLFLPACASHACVPCVLFCVSAFSFCLPCIFVCHLLSLFEFVSHIFHACLCKHTAFMIYRLLCSPHMHACVTVVVLCLLCFSSVLYKTCCFAFYLRLFLYPSSFFLHYNMPHCRSFAYSLPLLILLIYASLQCLLQAWHALFWVLQDSGHLCVACVPLYYLFLVRFGSFSCLLCVCSSLSATAFAFLFSFSRVCCLLQMVRARHGTHFLISHYSFYVYMCTLIACYCFVVCLHCVF